MTAELFGPYRLDELVGRGGMGEVYRAYDTVKDRTVALKRLPRHLAGDRGFQSQFRRESHIVARLREPHIIPIHDFGEIDGQLFIDMRLVEGVDLTALLSDQGPLAPARAVSIVAQVASALEAAHAEHLVHRDVKPANVLVIGADRGEDYVYLVDFGIAHDTSATQFGPGGAMVGSAEYMAPEQFKDGLADHRADIYSLGGLLHTALTGLRPFDAAGQAAQMYAHLHTAPPVPSTLRRDLPAALDRVVAVAMAKDPDDRFQSAIQFASAARAALAEHPVAAVGSKAPVTGTPFGGGTFGGGTLLRGIGWNMSPALGDMARRVADQASAVAESIGIPAGTSAGTSTGPSTDKGGRDALGISLFVAEAISDRTVGAVSELFWSKMRSTMSTWRGDRSLPNESSPGVSSPGVSSPGESPSDDGSPDETVVLKTVFEEGPNRTVIEVRIPARTAQESDLDLERILADAYAAANAQADGDLRGKHVTVVPDVSAGGPAAVTLSEADSTL